MPLIISPMALLESYHISPKVKHFVFTKKSEEPFTYLPGQFITIHLESQGKALKRSYSIANAPKNDNRIEFAAGFVAGGPGSELLFHLQPGEEVSMSGPFGRLILKEERPKRYVLVATSTGVTPYRSMLTELANQMAQHSELQVVIVQGVQKEEDILYREEFQAFDAQHTNAQFIACLSRESKSGFVSGHVQKALASLNLNPALDVVYLCGNPSMIDESFLLLQEKQFTVHQVIREKYLSR